MGPKYSNIFTTKMFCQSDKKRIFIIYTHECVTHKLNIIYDAF